MTVLPDILHLTDIVLLAGGGAVIAIFILRWWRTGYRDPLRGSPLRPNRLNGIHVWLCLMANLFGWWLGGLLAQKLAPAAVQEKELTTWQGILAANIAAILVMATCVWVAAQSFRGGWRGLGLFRMSSGRVILLSLAGSLAALAGCEAIVWATQKIIVFVAPNFQPPEHDVFQALHDPEMKLWMQIMAVLGAAVLAPISEELLFRGVLQTGLRKVMPVRFGSVRHRWWAILFTATLFGAMHTTTPHFIPALIALGILLGYLYERTGCLRVTILVHMLFNCKSLLWDALLH